MGARRKSYRDSSIHFTSAKVGRKGVGHKNILWNRRSGTTAILYLAPPLKKWEIKINVFLSSLKHNFNLNCLHHFFFKQRIKLNACPSLLSIFKPYFSLFFFPRTLGKKLCFLAITFVTELYSIHVISQPKLERNWWFLGS